MRSRPKRGDSVSRSDEIVCHSLVHDILILTFNGLTVSNHSEERQPGQITVIAEVLCDNIRSTRCGEFLFPPVDSFQTGGLT
ncbi:hypothetical protein [Methanogenium cariaci]|uniref:hypothetical protein n=1 Tax=Methanogenium cariaci TaxID=2197 RepID=UPI0007855D8B|nr:hypothetical protein [Methanogenium cariaci]